jgi:hypothetical protein
LHTIEEQNDLIKQSEIIIITFHGKSTESPALC